MLHLITCQGRIMPRLQSSCYNQRYGYFSYFSLKTYVVGTRYMFPWRYKENNFLDILSGSMKKKYSLI